MLNGWQKLGSGKEKPERPGSVWPDTTREGRLKISDPTAADRQPTTSGVCWQLGKSDSKRCQAALSGRIIAVGWLEIIEKSMISKSSVAAHGYAAAGA